MVAILLSQGAEENDEDESENDNYNWKSILLSSIFKQNGLNVSFICHKLFANYNKNCVQWVIYYYYTKSWAEKIDDEYTLKFEKRHGS